MTLRLTSIASVPAPGPKLCRDCKWVERKFKKRLCGLIRSEEPVPSYADCHHPSSARKVTYDPVTGEAQKDGRPHQYASVMRIFCQPCGPEAKLWETIR